MLGVWESKGNKMALPMTNLLTKTFVCAFSMLATKYVLFTYLCSPEDPGLKSMQAALDLPFTFGSSVSMSSLIRFITILTTQ